MKSFLKPLSLMLLCVSQVHADSWQSWLAQIKEEAKQKGIRQSIIDAAFMDVHQPSQKVKSFAKNQPEKRLTYNAYRKTRVDDYRIAIGRKRYDQNKVWIDQIGRNYGVDPCFVMSFWGLETSYGGYMGTFPVVQALTTLAYDSNRKDFFRNELFLALQILNEGHVQLAQFKGEWAGASGHPQFLPSSWMRYAVDFDGDGKKDIWNSKQDALASIANYMKMNGWQANQPWAVFVKLPKNFDMSLEGKSVTKTAKEWDDMGVRTTQGEHLPYSNLPTSIIKPYGGPVFLAYPNYRMILKYNNSIYYAGSIGYLADKICRRPSEKELAVGQNQ